MFQKICGSVVSSQQRLYVTPLHGSSFLKKVPLVQCIEGKKEKPPKAFYAAATWKESVCVNEKRPLCFSGSI